MPGRLGTTSSTASSSSSTAERRPPRKKRPNFDPPGLDDQIAALRAQLESDYEGLGSTEPSVYSVTDADRLSPAEHQQQSGHDQRSKDSSAGKPASDPRGNKRTDVELERILSRSGAPRGTAPDCNRPRFSRAAIDRSAAVRQAIERVAGEDLGEETTSFERTTKAAGARLGEKSGVVVVPGSSSTVCTPPLSDDGGGGVAHEHDAQGGQCLQPSPTVVSHEEDGPPPPELCSAALFGLDEEDGGPTPIARVNSAPLACSATSNGEAGGFLSSLMDEEDHVHLGLEIKQMVRDLSKEHFDNTDMSFLSCIDRSSGSVAISSSVGGSSRGCSSHGSFPPSAQYGGKTSPAEDPEQLPGNFFTEEIPRQSPRETAVPSPAQPRAAPSTFSELPPQELSTAPAPGGGSRPPAASSSSSAVHPPSFSASSSEADIREQRLLSELQLMTDKNLELISLSEQLLAEVGRLRSEDICETAAGPVFEPNESIPPFLEESFGSPSPKKNSSKGVHREKESGLLTSTPSPERRDTGPGVVGTIPPEGTGMAERDPFNSPSLQRIAERDPFNSPSLQRIAERDQNFRSGNSPSSELWELRATSKIFLFMRRYRFPNRCFGVLIPCPQLGKMLVVWMGRE